METKYLKADASHLQNFQMREIFKYENTTLKNEIV